MFAGPASVRDQSSEAETLSESDFEECEPPPAPIKKVTHRSSTQSFEVQDSYFVNRPCSAERDSLLKTYRQPLEAHLPQPRNSLASQAAWLLAVLVFSIFRCALRQPLPLKGERESLLQADKKEQYRASMSCNWNE